MTDTILDFECRFECDIAYLSEQLMRGRLTSQQLTQSAIDQHETSGANLNAYKSWQPEKALAMARQADQALAAGSTYQSLQGIPVSVKDIYGLEGYPIFVGARTELPAKWQRPGPVVETLAQQNAVFIGKTHTVEFAYGGLGVNNHWGTPKNPWDTNHHRVPGGSSAGAGVSLWEGSAVLALGTDTAGSVRLPASYTGNVGLKTSLGLWSTDGIVPLSPTFDTAGILTRTVVDSHIAFETIQQPGAYDEVIARVASQRAVDSKRSFRIGIDDGLMWTTTEHSIAEICLTALSALEDDACELVSFDFPEAERAIELRDAGSTISAELIEFLQSELPGRIDELDPVIRERIKMGGDISAIELLSRLRQLRIARQDARRRFENFDVIASPTVPLSPPLLSEVSTQKGYMPRNLLALQNTTVGSFLDFCAITVPVGLDRLGMPVGLQFMALARNEKLLLNIGRRLETIVRTRQMMPFHYTSNNEI